MRSYTFDNVNQALPVLMDALLGADEVGSRLGERTKEMTALGITLRSPWQRELVLPSRKANVASQIVETMWVLSGRNDIATLLPYLPRAADFSDDGLTWRAGYGPRLRAYINGQERVDQLDYIVETLRSSPGSRQAVATIWDPTVDTSPGKDIACNNWLHFLSRKGRLDLLVGIRSNDAMWGWSGINAFEWSVLLEIVAGMTGLEVGDLHFAVGSFHLYDRHWAKAAQIAKERDVWVDDSPRFNATGMDDMSSFDNMATEWWALEKAIRNGEDVGERVELWAEPMTGSWLRVLQWYWSGDEVFLEPLRNTRLAHACLVGTKPKPKADVTPLHPADIKALETLAEWEPRKPDFLKHVNELHAEKHAAYGDSWKRRGEAGILGNIARKVDRLGTGLDTSDETQLDTAIDLLVYLAKYKCWLYELAGGPEDVEAILGNLTGTDRPARFSDDLDDLFTMPAGASGDKARLVHVMLEQAFEHAKAMW